MKSLQIITNNHTRQFLYSNKVPQDILDNQFDYLDQEDCLDGFFKYRGYYYHLSDFMRIDKSNKKTSGEFQEYSGYVSETVWSGVLIKILDNCETFQVATYLS